MADELARFVVRVFMDGREPSTHKLPPWKKCLVLGVDKAALKAAPEPDVKYRPVLR